jgi:hypothetical protein
LLVGVRQIAVWSEVRTECSVVRTLASGKGVDVLVKPRRPADCMAIRLLRSCVVPCQYVHVSADEGRTKRFQTHVLLVQKSWINKWTEGIKCAIRLEDLYDGGFSNQCDLSTLALALWKQSIALAYRAANALIVKRTRILVQTSGGENWALRCCSYQIQLIGD